MSATSQLHDALKKIAFKQILMATDFSEASERALGYAIAIARRYGATLSVVHAIPPEPRDAIPLEPLPRELNRPRLEAEEQMKHLGETAKMKDLNHHLLLGQGRAWDVLSSVVQLQEFDLLVLGTHGRGGLKKLALGSVAEEILRRTSCPVLTVGPHVAPANSGTIEFKHILFATDFEPASARAFPFALSMAEECRAKLVLVHMVPPMPCADLGPFPYAPAACAAEEFIRWQRTLESESEKRLRDLIPRDSQLAAEPKYVIGMDFLPEGILDVAAANQSDLIVMGADLAPSPRLAAHIPWALTHEVICRAKCPVLTVSE